MEHRLCLGASAATGVYNLSSPPSIVFPYGTGSPAKMRSMIFSLVTSSASAS